ncbi:MAG: addiction module protein [Gemmataceae bacterium]|nr:addiction module protein [Gemmataceae bacterium]
MSPTIPTLESLGIDKLTADERVELAHAILDTVDAETARYELTDAQKQEIERRLAEHASNPGSAIPWEEVKSRLIDRLRRR